LCEREPMKKLINLDTKNYVALPNGITINAGGSMLVLNESILDTPEIKRLLEGPNPRLELKTVARADQTDS
jgi:hypothetical protein